MCCKVCNTWPLKRPSPLLLIRYGGMSIGGNSVWIREYQARLLFTVQDRGGADWIGSSKIILLTSRAWGAFGQTVFYDQAEDQATPP